MATQKVQRQRQQRQRQQRIAADLDNMREPPFCSDYAYNEYSYVTLLIIPEILKSTKINYAVAGGKSIDALLEHNGMQQIGSPDWDIYVQTMEDAKALLDAIKGQVGIKMGLEVIYETVVLDTSSNGHDVRLRVLRLTGRFSNCDMSFADIVINPEMRSYPTFDQDKITYITPKIEDLRRLERERMARLESTRVQIYPQSIPSDISPDDFNTQIRSYITAGSADEKEKTDELLQKLKLLSSDELDDVSSALNLKGLNLSPGVGGLIKMLLRAYIAAIEEHKYALERQCLADSKIKYTYKQTLQKTQRTARRRVAAENILR